MSSNIIYKKNILATVSTENTIFSQNNEITDVTNDLLKKLVPSNTFVYWQSAELVDFGYFNGNEIILNKHETNFDLLQEMRIFNENFELHIWKSLGKFKYRIRNEDIYTIDKNGNCLIQYVKLWGTKARQEGNFTILTEDRGMVLSLPIAFDSEYKLGINVFLEERRYIQEDEDGCIFFADRRFAGLYLGTEHGFEELEVKSNVNCY